MVDHRPEDLTVRRFADAAGASTAAIYTLFGGKAELVAAVRQRCVDQLSACQRAVPVEGAPTVRLRRLGQAYRQWARAHPHHYRVMFSGVQTFVPERTASDEHDPVAPLMAAIAAATATEELIGDPADIAASIWTQLHGAVMLELTGALGADVAEHTAEVGLETLLRGWHCAPPRDEDPARGGDRSSSRSAGAVDCPEISDSPAPRDRHRAAL